MEFDGLVAVVTGASGGIGSATVARLRALGSRVAALDVIDGPPGRADLDCRCDLADTVSVDAAIARVADTFGQVDVLVCNAGVGAVGGVADTSDEEWRRILDINVIGITRVARAALPWLRRSPSASIVMTGSVLSLVGVPQRVAYAASKGAVSALALAMAADLVHDGIRVNAVLPGTTATPWVQRLLATADDPVAAGAALAARQPLGRLVSPDEVAHAICHLASPLSAATTGTLLVVDGGMTGLRLPSPPR